MHNIRDEIHKEITNHDLVLYIKGSSDSPQCGFSGQLIKILDDMECAYKAINVLSSEELRQGIKEYSNWPTVPQLYVKGTFIGGCDIVREMFLAGELEALFVEKGIPFKKK